jgi:TetR/AcrR family transcriptional repressor of bet genes
MGRPSNREERRGQIVAALATVMAREGYAHATIAAIAKEAGLASGLIHYHFEDKQAILVALVAELVARLEARRVARLAGASGTPRARLHALVEAHVGLGNDADPSAVAAWVVVAAESLRQPEVRAIYAKAIATTLRRIELLLRAALRAERRSTRRSKELAAAITSAIEGAYLVHAAAPGVMPRGYAAPAIHALIDALIARAETGTS